MKNQTTNFPNIPITSNKILTENNNRIKEIQNNKEQQFISPI